MAVTLAQQKTKNLPVTVGRASAQTIGNTSVTPPGSTQVVSQPQGLTMPSPTQPPQVQTQQGANTLPFETRLAQAYQQYNQNAIPIPQIDVTKQAATISDMYAQQAKAISERNAAATQQGIANYQQQLQQQLPQYQQMRNQAEVQTEQGRSRMAEQLAAQGLGASGRAITQNAQLESGRVKGLSDINTQQQQMIDNVDFQINQLKAKGVSETNAQLADLEAKRSQALIDVDNRNNDMLLKIYGLQSEQQRQNLQDKIAQINFDYQANQNAINQAFQNKQFNAQQQQQALDNAYRDKQYAQQKAMDEANLQLAKEKFGFEKQQSAEQLALQRESLARSGSSGGGGGGGSTSGGESVNTNDYVAQLVMNSQTPNNLAQYGSSTAYMEAAKKDAMGSIGAAAYQKALKQAQTYDKNNPPKKVAPPNPPAQPGFIEKATNWVKNKWNTLMSNW